MAELEDQLSSAAHALVEGDTERLEAILRSIYIREEGNPNGSENRCKGEQAGD